MFEGRFSVRPEFVDMFSKFSDEQEENISQIVYYSVASRYYGLASGYSNGTFSDCRTLHLM